MSEIKWLPQALADIERLHAFLDDKNPEAARRVIKAIQQGAELLRKSSNIGRPMSDETGRREWFISFGTGAYVLRYMIDNKNTVVIIRVWHSRENIT